LLLVVKLGVAIRIFRHDFLGFFDHWDVHESFAGIFLVIEPVVKPRKKLPHNQITTNHTHYRLINMGMPDDPEKLKAEAVFWRGVLETSWDEPIS